MTREEAIKFGKRVLSLSLFDETHEFCEIAIKALEQKPCEDAISRQAAISLISNHTFYADYDNIDELSLIDGLKALPPVSTEKTGRWIFDERIDKHYYCSECKAMGVDYFDYCPYCGAKMEVE